MWLFDTPNTTFTDQNGNTVAIKNIKIIPSYSTQVSIPTDPNDTIDEIATRQSVYGDGMEMYAWKIFEANIIKLLEAQFDMSKIKSLDIPA